MFLALWATKNNISAGNCLTVDTIWFDVVDVNWKKRIYKLDGCGTTKRTKKIELGCNSYTYFIPFGWSELYTAKDLKYKFSKVLAL